MSIVDKLDALRAAAPGCSLAAFGDLHARLVLRSSASRHWPQERLDELCAQAARCFSAADDPALTHHFVPEKGRLDEAILLDPTDIRLFLRSPQDEADLICVVVNSVEDFERVAGPARQTVQDL